MMAKVNVLPALRSSGRLQSPSLHFGDAPQSASGEDLFPPFHDRDAPQSALMPSMLDRAFNGEL